MRSIEGSKGNPPVADYQPRSATMNGHSSLALEPNASVWPHCPGGRYGLHTQKDSTSRVEVRIDELDSSNKLETSIVELELDSSTKLETGFNE